MTFKIAEIRLDHWRKTTKVRTMSGKCVTRDMSDMPDPAGEKFRAQNLHGITNYVRIDTPTKGTVVRRRVVRPIGK